MARSDGIVVVPSRPLLQAWDARIVRLSGLQPIGEAWNECSMPHPWRHLPPVPWVETSTRPYL